MITYDPSTTLVCIRSSPPCGRKAEVVFSWEGLRSVGFCASCYMSCFKSDRLLESKVVRQILGIESAEPPRIGLYL